MGRGGDATQTCAPRREQEDQQRLQDEGVQIGRGLLAPPAPAAIGADGPRFRGQEVGLMALTGSRAYGLATDESDTDFRGFYIAESTTLLGMGSPQEQLESKDPDLCLWELAKFCRLAAKANPNVLELLWAPVVGESALGRKLRKQRRGFLSKRLLRSYSGFALATMKRARKQEPGSRQRRKSVFHGIRLLEQGASLLEHGEMSVSAANAAELRRLAEGPLEEAKERFDELDRKLVAIDSALPEEPDLGWLERVVVEARLERLP